MALPLLEAFVLAHGGRDRWSALESVTLDVRLRPWFLALKGLPNRERRLILRADPHRPFATLTFDDGSVGLFDHDRVLCEGGGERTIRPGPDGRYPVRLRWDRLDLLHFLGYALWNYATTPFCLLSPGVVCTEGPVWKQSPSETWRTLEVAFPDDFPTHCRRQTFYVGADHRLRRLDYTADVLGPLARGAHLVDDYQTVDGFAFPTRRSVHPRLPNRRPFRPITVIEGRVERVTVSPSTARGR
jgi:hypothetical protein